MAGRNSTNGVGGILTRLRRDVRGNVLILTAFAMIPLIGLVGGGIDLSRLYLVKARLQHACDAGALAGRKAMGAGTWAQASPNPPTIANQFFDGNFKSDGRASTDLTRSYAESGGRVTGSATVSVPMTMMAFFGAPARTLTVYCAAQQQIPNTDVMFVLDTTGSMACDPNGNNCNSGSTSKIVTLKKAVKCFYESVTQLTTNGSCPTGTSTGLGINNSSQIRFGFVPYAMNVNVGGLLPTSYVANSWYYQSRERVGNSSNWKYGRLLKDVSGLKNGAAWRTSLSLPIGDNQTNKTIAWEGCLEERPNIGSNPRSWTAQPTAADIRTVPNASNPDSYWGPALPGAEYYRALKSDLSNYADAAPFTQNDPVTTGDNYLSGDSSSAASYTDCPTQATKLTIWNTSAFDNYVDSLTAGGNTWHDIGMLWGARLMSPYGLFASENATTPSGGTIQRNMVFMTDGDAQASPCNYTSYGIAYYDQRTTTDVGNGSLGSCISERASLDNVINTRLATLCTLAKNEGINLYVVSFGGTGIDPTTKTRLKNCATDANHYFDATDNASLQTAFQTIAAQITQLRLVR